MRPTAAAAGAPRAIVARVARVAITVTAAIVAGCGGPSSPAPQGPVRTAVIEDREATAVAAALVFPGSAWELPGTEGLTMLSARTLLEQARPALDAMGAEVGVYCGPAAFTFTLVAARDTWRPALDVFLAALFRPAPGDAALSRARAGLAASLSLDRASPAWQARLAVRRALHEDSVGSGWLGPPCGVVEALDLFDLEDVRAGAHRFGPALAHAAVITPTDRAGVRDLLRAWLPSAAPPGLPAPRAVRPGRVYVERNTVTAWVAVAFPFPADADLEALRLLGAVLADAVAPGVDRPDVLLAGHELELHGSGGALVVRMVTAPDRAAAFADRVEALAAEYARSGVPESVRERVARRHRGERLLALASPEARAASLAMALATGRRAGPWPSLDIGAERLNAAASAVGEPARAVVGPRSARPAVVP